MIYNEEIRRNLNGMRNAQYQERLIDTFENVIHFVVLEMYEQGYLCPSSYIMARAACCVAKRNFLNTSVISDIINLRDEKENNN